MTEILNLTPGVHDLDETLYHADVLTPRPTLSNSLAKLILNRSPKHAWTAHPRLNPQHEPITKKVFDTGKAIHRAMLGKGQMFVAYPDEVLASNGAASTKAAKEWEAETRAAGRTPLKRAEVEHIHRVAQTATEQLADMGITFEPSRSELTALGEIDGVMCRALIDSAPEDPRLPLRDLKSCEDASPEACIAAVTRYSLDIQAAHYLDTWHAATSERRRFQFVFVEKDAPHGVGVVELYDGRGEESDYGDAEWQNPDWMRDAHHKTSEARRIWSECLEADHWPGYPTQVAVIGAPGWYRSRWADRAGGPPMIPKNRKEKPSTAAVSLWRQAQSPEGVA